MSEIVLEALAEVFELEVLSGLPLFIILLIIIVIKENKKDFDERGGRVVLATIGIIMAQFQIIYFSINLRTSSITSSINTNNIVYCFNNYGNK